VKIDNQDRFEEEAEEQERGWWPVRPLMFEIVPGSGK
jgi:hypothetical protein